MFFLGSGIALLQASWGWDVLLTPSLAYAGLGEDRKRVTRWSLDQSKSEPRVRLNSVGCESMWTGC